MDNVGLVGPGMQVVHVCSWSWLWWVGWGQGCKWWMCVVGHGYGGLGGVRDAGGGWYACRTKPRGWIACRSICRLRVDTLTSDHNDVQVRSSVQDRV